MYFEFVPNTLLTSGQEKPSIYAGFRAFVQMSRCFQGTNTYLSITIIIIKKFIIILFIFTKTLGQGDANPVFMRVCVVPDLVPNVLLFIWTNGISVYSLSNPKRFHYAFTVYPVSSGHILTGKGNRPVIMPVIAIRQMKRGSACAF